MDWLILETSPRLWQEKSPVGLTGILWVDVSLYYLMTYVALVRACIKKPPACEGGGERIHAEGYIDQRLLGCNQTRQSCRHYVKYESSGLAATRDSSKL
jgi:hypothetical protein